jgi:hypothetical protein
MSLSRGAHTYTSVAETADQYCLKNIYANTIYLRFDSILCVEMLFFLRVSFSLTLVNRDNTRRGELDVLDLR